FSGDIRNLVFGLVVLAPIAKVTPAAVDPIVTIPRDSGVDFRLGPVQVTFYGPPKRLPGLTNIRTSPHRSRFRRKCRLPRFPNRDVIRSDSLVPRCRDSHPESS